MVFHNFSKNNYGGDSNLFLNPFSFSVRPPVTIPVATTIMFYMQKKFYRRIKHSFITEKIHNKVHKNGRSRKDPREEKRLYLCCLLQTCHPSRIKTSFITAKKDMQKYLNMVEVENIKEKTKKLYLWCLKQMNDLPDLKICWGI